MYIKVVIILLISIIIISAKRKSVDNLLDIAVKSNEIFSSNLYKNVEKSENNLVISPLSAHLITEVLRLGSGGNTAKQIKKALNLPETLSGNGFKLLIDELQKESNATINIANRVYVSEGNKLNNGFQRYTTETLMADAVNVDFKKDETVDGINNWVEEATEYKIKDLIEPGSLADDTSVLLVNTLYFKGLWDSPFDWKSRKMFHKNSNEAVETDFLNMETVSYDDVKKAELPELSARMLDLPYEERKLRFLVILPNQDSNVNSLEKKMTKTNLNNLLSKTESTNHWHISIPKFKIESSIKLNEAFQKMGMTDMFVKGLADFSAMINSNTPPVYVSDIMQKTFIEINKTGTEAAAATFAKVSLASAIANPPTPFIADRPFLFYLIHKTSDNHSTVLFSGRFTSPN